MRYVLVAALNRARQLRRRLAAVSCLTVLRMPQTDGRCGSPARRAVGPGSPPRPAMRPMPGVQPRLIMGACISSDWTVPSVWRPPGEAPVANQGDGHAGALGHHGGAGGRFKFAAPALRLLAFWVERWVVPPAPHVNITMFEDCNLAGEISHDFTRRPIERPGSRSMGTLNRKKPATWSGRRESNPHDQLGRLELYH